MKGLFLSLCVLMVVVKNVHAIELQAYKSTGSSIVKLQDSAVESVWASTEPACLKDGSRIMGVNAAFKSKNLKYGDCSNSDAAKEKARMKGYTVTVIKFTELSDAMAKTVSGN